MKNNNFTYGMVIKKREKENRKIISTDSVWHVHLIEKSYKRKNGIKDSTVAQGWRKEAP